VGGFLVDLVALFFSACQGGSEFLRNRALIDLSVNRHFFRAATERTREGRPHFQRSLLAYPSTLMGPECRGVTSPLVNPAAFAFFSVGGLYRKGGPSVVGKINGCGGRVLFIYKCMYSGGQTSMVWSWSQATHCAGLTGSTIDHVFRSTDRTRNILICRSRLPSHVYIRFNAFQSSLVSFQANSFRVGVSPMRLSCAQNEFKCARGDVIRDIQPNLDLISCPPLLSTSYLLHYSIVINGKLGQWPVNDWIDVVFQLPSRL